MLGYILASTLSALWYLYWSRHQKLRFEKISVLKFSIKPVWEFFFFKKVGKKFATLLKVYYFTTIFQEIR